MTDDLLRVEDEGRLLLSKYASTAEAQAIEHLAGAILLAAVVLARAIRSGDDEQQ